MWEKEKMLVKSLPNDKTLDFLKSALGSVENIVGKGQKCWLPAFSPFPTMFSKASLLRVIESRDCVVKS